MAEITEDMKLGTSDNLGSGSTDVRVLPWWKNPINIVLLAVAGLLGSFGIGYLLGSQSSDLSHNSVDVGFLQDMRIHHEQASIMAMTYLEASPNGNTVQRMIAREILLTQSMETGRMIQLLRMFKESETNLTDQVMGWMNEPTPIDRMPGYATDEQMEQLQKSRDAEADALFRDLMIAHHLGGVHMVEYAMENAKHPEVRKMAESMLREQTGEINELRSLADSA
jgi:uncharacterized protein (DUF305 family)